jgi:hypothetical protein
MMDNIEDGSEETQNIGLLIFKEIIAKDNSFFVMMDNYEILLIIKEPESE